jgi:adenosylhomocysteine nucleosidase
MRIGMLAPMPSELRPLVKRLGLQPSPASAAGRKAHEGRVGSAEVVAATTGMGTAAAAEATRRLLGAGPIDHIMVVGIAGGIDDRLAIGDVLRPRVVIDGASGTEYQPHPLDGAPEGGEPGDGPRGDDPLDGALHTSDDFIVDPERVAALRAQGVVAMDMETAAVAAVCEALGCPWSVVRAISDRSADGLADEAVFGLAHQDGSPDLAAVARYVVRHPGRIRGLVRLGRDAGVATSAAARAALDACRRLPSP